MDKYVLYCRVSTGRQGRSGLGLNAQEDALRSFVAKTNGESLNCFIEVETAGNKDVISIYNSITLDSLLRKRPKLREAIELSRKENAILLVKESSRLSRFSLLIDYLIATGIRFQCTDSPQDEPMIIKIKTAIVEEELIKNSRRISEAFKKMKDRGKKLGTPRNFTAKDRRKGQEAKEKMNADNDDYVKIYLLAKSMLKTGKTINDVMNMVNKMKYKTIRGCKFNADAIRRILNNEFIKNKADKL